MNSTIVSTPPIRDSEHRSTPSPRFRPSPTPHCHPVKPLQAARPAEPPLPSPALLSKLAPSSLSRLPPLSFLSTSFPVLYTRSSARHPPADPAAPRYQQSTPLAHVQSNSKSPLIVWRQPLLAAAWPAGCNTGLPPARRSVVGEPQRGKARRCTRRRSGRAAAVLGCVGRGPSLARLMHGQQPCSWQWVLLPAREGL